MDIDVTVATIRDLVKAAADTDHTELTELADHVDNMFTWLDKGGHLPACWGE